MSENDTDRAVEKKWVALYREMRKRDGNEDGSSSAVSEDSTDSDYSDE